MAGTVERLWVDLYKHRTPWLVEEPSHTKWKYLAKLAEIGGELLADTLRRLGDTYHGMPMASFLKACEKHDFLLETFPASINPGGRVSVLVRERDGGVVVGYAHDGSMRSAADLVPRRDEEGGFATECHDCLDAFGMVMDVHDHGGDGYPLQWDNPKWDRMHVTALLCPVSELKLWYELDLKPEAASRYIEAVCRQRIATLRQPWRSMFERILKPKPVRLLRRLTDG
ncbi:hypothetical protein OIU34_19815 [Pararhizobium sp. BT-229]|uniref:hypothetical protein n=1 Tax=Pararhizobium sp. BT-229 TaxID=2986923 RepID=UPI0021F75473|nr:hypothetical protein [Pararhizobium sp. BT-229]MCV9964133.1 hypothetical protein [Pararhizobium sp. BT-229]